MVVNIIKKVSAKKQIDKLIKDGAKIIDVGGESTRPGSKWYSHK